jgi:hypothetical protein
MPVLVSVASVTYYIGPTFPLAVAIFVSLFYRQVRPSLITFGAVR